MNSSPEPGDVDPLPGAVQPFEPPGTTQRDSRTPTGEAVLAWVSTHSTEVVHLTPWQTELIVRMFEMSRHARGAAETMRQLHDQLARTQSRRRYAEFVALVRRFGVEQEPLDGPPTDPMQRALWLRRNRNTGPTRRRAPRTIPPRGAR
ncbi:hypothetical protein [Micromonospora sp. RV43]|uniref:hypothetical protein n=1 Tax=Micromonospora sp. RV43 TaxID=1661387 RepID=UPI00064B9E74|nr:hypothetical protein [Micromonospora sp. RV43]